MGLIQRLGTCPVALDTAVFVSFVEAHPRFGSIAAKLFESIDAGELQGVTSALTLLETLVVPTAQETSRSRLDTMLS